MNITDLINGFFEFLGFLFIIPSIKNIIKEKEVKGVNWLTVGFFTIWGVWNLIFYSCNNLSLSLVGSIFLCIANFIWLILLIKYTKKY